MYVLIERERDSSVAQLKKRFDQDNKWKNDTYANWKSFLTRISAAGNKGMSSVQRVEKCLVQVTNLKDTIHKNQSLVHSIEIVSLPVTTHIKDENINGITVIVGCIWESFEKLVGPSI